MGVGEPKSKIDPLLVYKETEIGFCITEVL